MYYEFNSYRWREYYGFDNTAGMGKHELNRTGSLIEYPYFYDDLTGMENLLIHSKYMGYYDKKELMKS